MSEGKYSLVYGEMSEWLKELAWKAGVGETLPRVRIPLFPPGGAESKCPPAPVFNNKQAKRGGMCGLGNP